MESSLTQLCIRLSGLVTMPRFPENEQTIDYPAYGICVWSTNDGWFWDEAEDLNSDDSVTPTGPFEDRASAIQNVHFAYGGSEQVDVIDGAPGHYPVAAAE